MDDKQEQISNEVRLRAWVTNDAFYNVGHRKTLKWRCEQAMQRLADAEMRAYDTQRLNAVFACASSTALQKNDLMMFSYSKHAGSHALAIRRLAGCWRRQKRDYTKNAQLAPHKARQTPEAKSGYIPKPVMTILPGATMHKLG